MKKYILFFAAFALSLMMSAQTKQLKAQFEEYTKNGYYKKEGDVVLVQDVLNNVPGTKEQVYAKVKKYFNNYFKEVNSEVVTDDNAAGVYAVNSYYKSILTWTEDRNVPCALSAYITVKVQIRNNRVRVTVESDAWNVRTGLGKAKKEEDGEILKYAPFTGKKLFDKDMQTEGFLILADKMYETTQAFKEYMVPGSTTPAKAAVAPISKPATKPSGKLMIKDDAEEDDDVVAPVSKSQVKPATVQRDRGATPRTARRTTRVPVNN